ncbi:MAG: pyridoxamine 5'-phosphate oxidase [Ferruginibacter sp.]
MKEISAIRKEYALQSFDEKDANDNPFLQFEIWWQHAAASAIEELNAMSLATAGTDGKPSARIVLLKGYDEDGFIFYTNYESHKGRELAENPFAAMILFWKELERQVRVEGRVVKIPSADSDEYFASRPKGSQLGALVSPQSQVIKNRDVLVNKLEEVTGKYEGETSIPRPPHWGGYRIIPSMIEFWQGRRNRLHDRIQYLRKGESWEHHRLAP